MQSAQSRCYGSGYWQIGRNGRKSRKEKVKCNIIKKEENCKKEGNMLRCG